MLLVTGTLLPQPPDDEETRALLEDFKGMVRNCAGTEYAKALLYPSAPGGGTTFRSECSETAWRTYWLGRRGVGGVVDAEVVAPATAEGKVAAIMRNIWQLLLSLDEHTGESTGNLDVQKTVIEDQVRALVGLPPRQPELGLSDGWLGESAEQAAIATLRSMNFTYHGGSRWKPPLGSFERAQLVNGLIRRMKAKPGRYCVTSVTLLALGALYFVEVDAEGKIYQLTLEGQRDGVLHDTGWKGDEFVLDYRLIEEFPNPPAQDTTLLPLPEGHGSPDNWSTENRGPSVGGPTYYVRHPDDSYSVAEPLTPQDRADLQRAARYLASNNDADGEMKGAEADRIAAVLRGIAGETVKCDGNHGGPRCADPECWNDTTRGDKP